MSVFNPRVRFAARSIRTLLLAGLTLVVLPVAIALEHSRRLNDELALESAALLAAGIEGVREGARLRDQLVALERLVRQYRVLADPGLLGVVDARVAEIDQAMRWLHGAGPEVAVAGPLDLIGDGLQRLERALQPPRRGVGDVEPVLAVLGPLHAAAREVDGAVQRAIDLQMNELRARLDTQRRALLRLIAAMVILSVVLAVIYTSLVTRPIRALGETLKRLGNGELEVPVAISGPAEIAQLAGELEWLRARLAEHDDNRHDFLRLVSHELKTPLASLGEGTSLLAEERIGELNVTQREVIVILSASVQRLDAQIRNLLTFSGLTQGVMRSEPREQSLAGCIRAAVDGLRLVLERKAITMQMPDRDATAFADPDQVRMILDNLLSNAIKHAGAGGTVAVELVAGAREVVVRVVDDGPGISPADRERVFSPFFKSTSRDSMGAGTGIGLAVVRLCARANGGDVEVEANTTAGAAVRVTLPGSRNARAA